MNTSPTFPFATNWIAQDLADAVPLRLFELFAFDAGADAANRDRCAHPTPRPPLRGGYVRPGAMPASFLVHF